MRIKMTDISKALASLSPEKRKLLEQKLKQKGSQFNSFPLSFAQQRLWFLDQLEPGNAAYNIPTAIRMEGTLDIPAMEKSLKEIVQRHEILRTTFATVGGKGVQVISKEAKVDLDKIDLSNLSETERQAKTELLIREKVQLSFNLPKGPLGVITLIKHNDKEHILLMVMHHIIADGWSMGIIVNEFAALYQSFAGGKPSPLPKLKIQYADFAQWQRKWLQGERLDKQLNYWKEQLGHNPPVLNLPTDRPRPAIKTDRGANAQVSVSIDILKKIQELSAREGTTTFMTLLTAFQTLLYRYSAQDDICVGTPIANRNRAETEGLIGFFVNTLVIRTDLSGNPSFRELLKKMKETSLNAFAHQDLPFEMLVEELAPDRSLNHSPLFQVFFTHQIEGSQQTQLPGLNISQVEFENQTTKFDITLRTAETKAGLLLSIDYSIDLFDDPTIERFLKYFHILLEAIVNNPDQKIGAFPLLDEKERNQLVYDWNQTDCPFPADRCMHQLFEEQVEKTPQAPALEFEEQIVNYGELNRKANQLANHLLKSGLEKESLVGVYLDRSPETVISVLAVLKAGGAYVPIDPAFPADRISYLLEDTSSPIILSKKSLTANLPDTAAKTICLDTEWDAIASEADGNPDAGVIPENLAYIIYTSGSTGKPKGTLIEHKSLSNYLNWVNNGFLSGDKLTIPYITKLSFDASLKQIMAPLLRGGKIWLLSDEVIQDPGQILKKIASKENVHFNSVPSLWQTLINTHCDSKDSKLTKSVKAVIVGGESISKELVRKTFEILPHVKMWNAYGPSETTSNSSFSSITETGRITIGRPVDNTQLYILDKFLQPTPIGIPGELYIGGTGLSRGYLNRPDLTAAAFIPNPFSKKPGSRMYKTGDLVLYHAGGNIEFLGRLDHQVKIRGFRIELGEIETALNKHEFIKENVVTVHESKDGDKRLAAFVVPKNTTIPGVNELRSFLKTHLPDYMLPSIFVTIERIPVSATGKIDRKALVVPDDLQMKSTEEFIAPRTPTEEMVANIFSEVLDIKLVGAADNFFELGGHSLIATQVISRIRDHLNIELPLRDLFQTPTVEKLAETIEKALLQKDGVEPLPIVVVPRVQDLPLSFAQQRLWFLDQLEPESSMYNIPMAFRLRGPLDISSFERTITEIIKRHEILRTTIVTVNGKPQQVIAQNLPFTTPLIDLSKMEKDLQDEEVKRLAMEEANRPFMLNRGPLMRVTLLRLDDNDHAALVTMHHIISDGWSMGILMQEVSIIYEAFSKNRPSPLPALSIQYVDYAAWQRQLLQGEIYNKQLDYWRKQLADISPRLDLPTDHPRPAVQTYKGDHISFSLSKDLTAAIKDLGKGSGATIFMTLLAAFQTLLYRYSNQDDICVGTPIAGRNRVETEGLIGFFINTLVLRTDFCGNPSFSEILQQVSKTALGAYAHQDLPFEKLVDEIQPERDISHSPLFQTMFVLQNIPKRKIQSSELTLESIEAESKIAKFDLTLTITEQPDQLFGGFEYNTDLFEKSTITRMIDHFRILLENVIVNPNSPVLNLSMISEDERKQLLIDWSGKDAPHILDDSILGIFEKQVKQTPDNIALEFGEDTLTYIELNQRANQLAHYLQKSDVAADVLTGVCIERSIEMIIGMLGILKAGGAYVPIDPSYPKERLTYILEDSNIPVLLTQEKMLDILPEHKAQTVCIDTDREVIQKQSISNCAHIIDRDNLAYMIYTSGSTGKPKGTMITHRGLTNYLNWCYSAYPLKEGRGSLVHSTIAFDATVSAVFTPLLTGKTITLVSDNADLEALGKALLHYKDFNIVKITPAHLYLLSNQIQPQEAAQLTRAFVIGGENLTSDQIDFWQKNAPNTLLFNEYGPTETVVGCVVYEALKWQGGGSVPIGRAIGNTRVYILDDNLQPVPAGVPGELYIGGEGVARGYLKRPDLTAECFIPNSFSAKKGCRLYKTGDLVRYLKDGNMEFLDRVDTQVKIRGYRIELGEIETVLGQHPHLKDVVVIVREDKAGNKRLTAYYIVKDSAKPTINDLRNFLKDQLPEYMTPAVFVKLDEFPLTANGKVDRKALPEPDDLRPELETKYIAPVTENEKILAEIWQKLLGIKQVGINDNFFELGGDSILSIQFISRARQEGLQITPVQIFKNQTVAQLSAVASSAPIIEAEQGIVSGDVPFTPIQHWFFAIKLPEPQHWNQSIILEVKHKLDSAALEKTVAALLSHHDALRLRFDLTETGWKQNNAGLDENIPFNLFDLAGLSKEEQKSAIEQNAAKLQASLNISSGPLLQAAYFDLGGQPGRLLIIVHHLAMDGVSWRILIEDFQAAYQQILAGQEAQLSPKTTSFKHWAEKLTEYSRSEAQQKEVDYWISVSRKPIYPLPVNDPAGENTEQSVDSLSLSLNENETKALLQDVPAVYNTQINDILLTALIKGFSRWTGKRSLLLNMEGHGREDIIENIDLSRTIGWFTSLFPVYLDLGKSVNPGEAIKTIKEQLHQIPNKGVGFGILRYLSSDEQVKTQLSAIDHAQVTFNYLGQFDQALPENSPFGLANENKGAVRSPKGFRSSLIDITGGIGGGKLGVSFSFSKNIFRKASIDALANGFIAELRDLIEHCKAPEAGGYTVSDFKLAKLDDKKLDKVMAQLGRKRRMN
jgi:amino acid adenylation domain-containing protein/non-ribosomal peptide synthase protein (TIGR01720 family)